MNGLVFFAFGFFCGALPLAVWLGRVGLRRDIREVGDRNPGAFNVIRSGGLAWGGLAIVLEVSKGALPVGIAAQVVGLSGWELVLAGIAPVLGHAYSPFLGFRGGKAVAVTLGVWIGLSLWTVPVVGVPSLVVYTLFTTVSGWAVMLTMGNIAVLFVLVDARWEWWIVLAVNIVVFGVKHALDLQKPLRVTTPAKRLRKD
ncbi:MAG: glycerol-3-phosphate acyltransferase [Chloroflexi bacterium]|nr:glycerol-3-phosphate acyltransferase [Chloroflexota bacterium]